MYIIVVNLFAIPCTIFYQNRLTFIGRLTEKNGLLFLILGVYIVLMT